MKAANKRRDWTEGDIRKIAVEASADPRSVRTVLKGGSVRGMADDRIRTVLRRMGVEPQADQGGRR